MKDDKHHPLLIIYTGGTIGMKQNPADGALQPFDFSQISEAVPELAQFDLRTDTSAFQPPLDSADIEPSHWVKLARLVKENYDRFDGFVILHGTDTMAYTASVLSFMLENLGKPVVLTGSQLPVGVARTDGRENLVSAVEIASARGADGNALVPEVSIFCGGKLLRGNRTTKVSAEDFRAYDSPNLPPLAVAGIQIRYNSDLIHRRGEDAKGAFHAHTQLDTRVSILKLHPGITPETVRGILGNPETRAVILETYGSGNALCTPWFLECVRKAKASGKILMNVSQCLSGTVDMHLYATGKKLGEAGVASGHDSTTEAALGKLFYLMGKSADNAWVERMLEKNLRGEISFS